MHIGKCACYLLGGHSQLAYNLSASKLIGSFKQENSGKIDFFTIGTVL